MRGRKGPFCPGNENQPKNRTSKTKRRTPPEVLSGNFPNAPGIDVCDGLINFRLYGFCNRLKIRYLCTRSGEKFDIFGWRDPLGHPTVTSRVTAEITMITVVFGKTCHFQLPIRPSFGLRIFREYLLN